MLDSERRYPMHCMDCKRAYAHSPVEGSTGLCLPCLRIREDNQLKEETQRCSK